MTEIQLIEAGAGQRRAGMGDVNQIAKQVNQRAVKQEKLVRLMEAMEALIDGKFTGYIKINFSQGGIGRVEKFEEILK